MFFKTSVHDYENLCSLDVLRVKEEHARQDEVVYDEFKKNSWGMVWNEFILEKEAFSTWCK